MKLYFRRQFSFARSISRPALEKIYNLILINIDSSGVLSFSDPKIGIWSYELEIQLKPIVLKKYKNKASKFKIDINEYSQADRMVLIIHDDDGGAILAQITFDIFFEEFWQEYLHPIDVVELHLKRYFFPKNVDSFSVYDALKQTEGIYSNHLEIGPCQNRIYAYYAD
jgi:hypothetical protein